MDIGAFKWWKDKGFYRIGHFFTHRGPFTLSHCSSVLKMPNLEKFSFLQISLFLHSIWPAGEATSLTTYNIGALEIRALERASPQCMLTPPQKHPYMLAWEKDLNSNENLDSWSARLQVAYKGIINVSLVDTGLKLVTRWYLVPNRLARMYATASSDCFRGCLLRGSMLHVWWECPKMRVFWNRVFSML